jgi:hypothetical protein
MNRINELIEQKFTFRFEISSGLQQKLSSITKRKVLSTDNWRYWLVAASILLFLSFHLLQKNETEAKEQDQLIDIYSETWNNQL